MVPPIKSRKLGNYTEARNEVGSAFALLLRQTLLKMRVEAELIEYFESRIA